MFVFVWCFWVCETEVVLVCRRTPKYLRKFWSLFDLMGLYGSHILGVTFPPQSGLRERFVEGNKKMVPIFGKKIFFCVFFVEKGEIL